MAIPQKNRWMQAFREGEGSVSEAREFDPRSYLRDVTEGSFAQFQERMREVIDRLRGQHVGMGRLNTGFATIDEGNLMERGMEDLNRRILGAGMRTARLEQRGRESSANRYLDILQGVSDRELQERRRRGNMFGGLGALGGGLAGAFLPGIGPYLGSTIGSQLGQALGS